MAVWAIADLHLSFGVPDKAMDVFGDEWIGYTDKVASYWHELIKADDLVLIAGDISWAMHPEEAKPDLEWIHQLPGTKVIVRGNHDYWWSSLSKVEKVLPSSIHLIQNNAFHWNDVSVVGSRLWDTSEFNFGPYINYQVNPRAKPLTAEDKNKDEAEHIFQRELGRLELSLKCLDKKSGPVRLAMTHYPPISADLKDSRAAQLLEKYHISACVFGHLHRVKRDVPMFGTKNGVKYILTACDYLDFKPVKVL
ncbi:MAG: metallophosphoesterase [Parachlamydiaceae bacterium]|nr:metallophosphoesterase [Parachlamydiaceae bacterium]